jgi:serine/threonine protein kinase
MPAVALPTSTRIKLIDLTSAEYIPLPMPESAHAKEPKERGEPSPFLVSARFLGRKAQAAAAPPSTSLNFRPPELDVAGEWDGGVDMWAIGCVLAEMYSGKADLPAELYAASAAKVTNEFRPPPMSAFGEIGRCPLFSAQSASEHVAMVAKCVGPFSAQLADLVDALDANDALSPAAARRVASTPPLRDALERNRELLALDRSAQRALANARLKATAGPLGGWFGGGDPTALAALAAADAAEGASAVAAWQREAVHDLAASLLAPDRSERLSPASALAHPALAAGLFGTTLF